MYRFHSVTALAVFMVVGYRIAGWMRLGRTRPDKDAAEFFEPDEVRAACRAEFHVKLAMSKASSSEK